MPEYNTRIILIILAIAIPILIAQGAWIFKDAKKRGEKFYWLWGIYGLMHCPGSIIVYLVITRIILDKNRKKKLGK